MLTLLPHCTSLSPFSLCLSAYIFALYLQYSANGGTATNGVCEPAGLHRWQHTIFLHCGCDHRYKLSVIPSTACPPPDISIVMPLPRLGSLMPRRRVHTVRPSGVLPDQSRHLSLMSCICTYAVLRRVHSIRDRYIYKRTCGEWHISTRLITTAKHTIRSKCTRYAAAARWKLRSVSEAHSREIIGTQLTEMVVLVAKKKGEGGGDFFFPSFSAATHTHTHTCTKH